MKAPEPQGARKELQCIADVGNKFSDMRFVEVFSSCDLDVTQNVHVLPLKPFPAGVHRIEPGKGLSETPSAAPSPQPSCPPSQTTP